MREMERSCPQPESTPPESLEFNAFADILLAEFQNIVTDDPAALPPKQLFAIPTNLLKRGVFGSEIPNSFRAIFPKTTMERLNGTVASIDAEMSKATPFTIDFVMDGIEMEYQEHQNLGKLVLSLSSGGLDGFIDSLNTILDLAYANGIDV